MMFHPEYAYRHLRPSSDEIRLLRIAHNQDELELQTITLDGAPQYIALSYTWGPAEDEDGQQENVGNATTASTPKHKLVITTKSGASHYLEVLDNLYQGLTEIRRRMDTESDDFSAKPQDLYVWADAICINQRDTDEVNQQVNMMDRIYSQASKVVVWLGADTRGEMPRVDKALKALSKMRRIITDERLTPGSAWRESSGIPDTDMADLLTIVGLPPLDDSVEWSVILGLFNRTWFRRLWVVQEIALASKIEVWCGGATFSWRTIERVTELLKWDLEAKIMAGDKTRADSFYSLPSRSASILASIRKWAISSRVPSSLFGTYKLISGRDKYHSSFAYAVLGALFPYEATDPRDKVFGALGLVRKLSTDLATSPLGDADYSLTAGEVYTAATKKIISGTGWLGMLSLVKVPKERRHELVGPLPSWVPTLTWNSVPTLSLRGDHSFNAAGRFRADLTGQSPGSPPSIQFGRAAATNIDAIGFPARRIAIVRRKSEPLQDFMCQKSTFEAGVDLLLDLAPRQGESEGTYPTTGEPVIDAFWKTMMAGRRRFTRKQYGNNATDPSVAREQFLRFWLYAHLLLALVEWGNKDMRVKRAAVVDVKEFKLAVPDRLGYMERLLDPAQTRSFQPSEGPLNIPGHAELLATISKTQQPRDYHGWLDFAREQMVPFSFPAVSNRVMFSTKRPPPQPTGATTATTNSAADGINDDAEPPHTGESSGRAENNISYLGLGHEEMREGDEVWISPRGPVPLLLRPLLDEAGGVRRGYYSLIGECYLHGAMYGEVFERLDEEQGHSWETVWLE